MVFPSEFLRPLWRLNVLLVSMLWGCTDAGGGCAALESFPDGGRYEGPKSDNVVNIRLSSEGFGYLNSNWKGMVEAFAPGQVLTFPFACAETKVPVIGEVVVADQGGLPDGGVCQSESCGQLDGKCDAQDLPKMVSAKVVDFSLNPAAPDSLAAVLSLEIDTGEIMVDTKDRSHGACTWLAAVKCSVNFNTALSSPSTNQMNATVKFTIDQKWDKLLSFEVTSVGGTAICGASGAPGQPSCLDPGDLDFKGENTCGSIYCGVADWNPVKEFILKRLSPKLESELKDALAAQRCEPCGPGLPACPKVVGGESSCNVDGICIDSATNQCVPRTLGVQGRVNPAVALAAYGVPASSKLDMSIAAGSSVTVDQGISLGTRGGILATSVAPCVPPAAAPVFNPIAAPNFEAEAPAGSKFHVGLGISQPFLDLTMHHAHQAGALCLNINSSNVGLVNTGLFKTFLGSLGNLATRDGKDAPMMIVLRPGRPPTVKVGAGTYDPVTKKPIDPLMTLVMRDLTVDFYALFDDRYARLFSLTADVALPMSLIFNGCSSVQPALGDVKQLITNIRTANSEMLAEDPKLLADLIPAIIGLAEPALASALSPFALPELAGYKLKVDATRGVGKVPGTESYSHLALYASLVPANSACVTSGPKLSASLKRSEIPPAEALRLRGRPLPWPVAVLDVATLGGEPSEYSYRINGGLWSPYLPAASNELEVTHPGLLFQGNHRIELRARLASQPAAVSAPVTVSFPVDYEPPTVRLFADRGTQLLSVHASDLVSPPESLEFAYQLGAGALTAFGPPRMVDLSAVEAAGGLLVKVRDQAGNVGEARYRVASTDARAGAGASEAGAPGEHRAGCSSAGPSLHALGLLLLLLGAWRRQHP